MSVSLSSSSFSGPLKFFILENREWFRFFLREWLESKNGHQVRFFGSADALAEDGESRHVDLLAAHLLPSRFHVTKNRNQNPHRHAVYGEGLDIHTVLWCRKSGVAGILDLRDEIDSWNRCLEGLKNGEITETPTVQQTLNNGHGKGVSRLSRRETEVARMLVKGFSAKQVAAALGTSEGTVKNQRKAVYRKLGIVRATQLAGAMGLTKFR